MLPSRLRTLLALVLAGNYLAFQAEIFDDEYEANHPSVSDTPSISNSSLNWESFDKENAQQAFVFDSQAIVRIIGTIRVHLLEVWHLNIRWTPVRDKSPPSW